MLVAPFGGTERRFSTAPFSVGVPLPAADEIRAERERLPVETAEDIDDSQPGSDKHALDLRGRDQERREREPHRTGGSRERGGMRPDIIYTTGVELNF